MINIWSIYWSKMPYYDRKNKTMSFKLRPVLIIGESDESEYNILPISKCESEKFVDKEYDIPITLKKKSYIRVHKQSTIHLANIDDEIVNLKDKFESIYKEVCIKLKKYNEQILK